MKTYTNKRVHFSKKIDFLSENVLFNLFALRQVARGVQGVRSPPQFPESSQEKFQSGPKYYVKMATHILY